MQEKPFSTLRVVTSGLACGGAVLLGIAAIGAILTTFQLAFQSVFAKEIGPGHRWLLSLGFSKITVAVTIKIVIAALLFSLYRAARAPWTTRRGFCIALIGMGGLAEGAVLFVLGNSLPANFFVATFVAFLALALAVGLFAMINVFTAYPGPGLWPSRPSPETKEQPNNKVAP